MTGKIMKSVMLSAAVLTATFVTSAWAHHSHAMFDETKEDTITGTVKRYSFANPHVYLFVNVTGADGKVVTYPIEMSYIGNMISRGVKASTFKEGDKITVKFNPLRDGEPGGSYTGVTDAAGNEYK